MIRTLLAGIAGGIAMYVMMSILHMSPIAQIGFSQMKNDAPVLAALKTGTEDKPGLYIYPTVDMSSKDAMTKAAEVRKTNPSGIFIYERAGVAGMSVSQLVHEFLTELVQSILVAALLSFTAIAGYVGRVGFVTLAGVLSAVTTNVSYTIWYAFPLHYTVANMGIEIAGFLAAGLAIAAIVKTRAA